ncbi:MAG: tRNA threonylcarbamoyladenosine dehydratase [Bacilli bacterium]|nr:tRNA threonylcarbamoyladenosine dehydratase [Bacilli bacterium]
MFDRLELLIGKSNLQLIKKKNIIVIGIGGVGGFVVESLIRSGIENITIIDNDKIDITNKNRQLIALDSTIGKDKVEVLKQRMLDINQNLKIQSYNLFLDKDTIKKIDFSNYDYIVDCCDTVETKKLLIKLASLQNKKIISSMGTGKRLDPSKLAIMDIRKTNYDPIARILRKYIKDENIKDKVLVCSSTEIPRKINSKMIASNIFVPGSAGILIASYIIRDFIGEM